MNLTIRSVGPITARRPSVVRRGTKASLLFDKRPIETYLAARSFRTIRASFERTILEW